MLKLIPRNIVRLSFLGIIEDFKANIQLQQGSPVKDIPFHYSIKDRWINDNWFFFLHWDGENLFFVDEKNRKMCMHKLADILADKVTARQGGRYLNVYKPNTTLDFKQIIEDFGKYNNTIR